MKLDQDTIQTGEATYCPEDNKLRLYVGRVPTPEYRALRSEGWTSTPKQDCDFVATWTPDREDTALAYGENVIDDEDQDPADRAADRAERFGGYCDKRSTEAHGHADNYNSQPTAHGFQNEKRAERAAARHDRHADRALNAWDKAEYWQHRTAGVINHALYVSGPGVRMGRIKKLESQKRKNEKEWTEATTAAQRKFDVVQRVLDHATGAESKLFNMPFLSYSLSTVKEEAGTKDADTTPEEMRLASLSAILDGYSSSDKEKTLCREARKSERAALEIARDWIEGRTRPEDWKPESSRWNRHLVNRLAYENQMLEAQGGRLEQQEIEIGGTIGGRLIVKTAKSPATKRITSVKLLGPQVSGYAYQVNNIDGTEWAEYHFSTERIEPGAYKAPTDESRAMLKDYKTALKAKRAKAPKAPQLLNPTDDDAERLQTIWNADPFYQRDTPAEVLRMTQAEYSAHSKGSYARCAAVYLEEGGAKESSRIGSSSPYEVLCKVRCKYRQVVILTDKPQKSLPADLWTDPKTAAQTWCRENLHLCRAAIHERETQYDTKRTNDETVLNAWTQLRRAKWASSPYQCKVETSKTLTELFRSEGTYTAKADGTKEPAAKPGKLVQAELLSA